MVYRIALYRGDFCRSEARFSSLGWRNFLFLEPPHFFSFDRAIYFYSTVRYFLGMSAVHMVHLSYRG
jgi:hypothetical protein